MRSETRSTDVTAPPPPWPQPSTSGPPPPPGGGPNLSGPRPPRRSIGLATGAVVVVAALGVLALLALPVLFFGWVTLQAGEREVLVLEDDAPASTTTVDGPAAVPGEAVDQWSWRAGEVMAVVGLAHDDVLELRSDPGLGYPVLAELDAGAADLVVTGNGWVTPDNEWLVEVRTGDEGVPVTVMSAAPTIGDRAEVTYDVIGYADDAELGDRVRVFATRSDSGDGFVLASVEATALCSRGVQAGMCL